MQHCRQYTYMPRLRAVSSFSVNGISFLAFWHHRRRPSSLKPFNRYHQPFTTAGEQIRVITQVLPAKFFPVFLQLLKHRFHTKGLLQVAQFRSATGGQQSIMTYPHKPAGKDMPAETPQKLNALQSHHLLTVITVIAPAECNAAIINIYQPVIADGHLVRITPQVFNHLLSDGVLLCLANWARYRFNSFSLMCCGSLPK